MFAITNIIAEREMFPFLEEKDLSVYRKDLLSFAMNNMGGEYTGHLATTSKEFFKNAFSENEEFYPFVDVDFDKFPVEAYKTYKTHIQERMKKTLNDPFLFSKNDDVNRLKHEYDQLEKQISDLQKQKDELHNRIVMLHEKIGLVFAVAKNDIRLRCHGYESKAVHEVFIKKGSRFKIKNYPFENSVEIKALYDEYFTISLEDSNFEVLRIHSENDLDLDFIKDSNFVVL